MICVFQSGLVIGMLNLLQNVTNLALVFMVLLFTAEHDVAKNAIEVSCISSF